MQLFAAYIQFRQKKKKKKKKKELWTFDHI